jgi:hypothetical protein
MNNKEIVGEALESFFSSVKEIEIKGEDIDRG